MWLLAELIVELALTPQVLFVKIIFCLERLIFLFFNPFLVSR